MRRSLPLLVVAVAAFTATVPAPPIDAAPSTVDRPAAPGAAAGPGRDAARADIMAALDPTVVVPALEAAFGDRYGGFWIEPRQDDELLHVAVVGATDADRATVAEITGSHPGVRVDSVTHGYDDLLAARDEIVVAMDDGSGVGFTVEADVATNSVVVRTESADTGGTTAVAQQAARRGARRAPQDRAAVAGRNGMMPSESATGPDAAPAAADVATAVRIEPNAAIVVAPVATRRTFPPNTGGLAVAIAAGSRLTGCTSGFVMTIRGFGAFATMAGHCGNVGHGVAIGHRLVGLIAGNTYYPTRRVQADAAIVSTSAPGFRSDPGIRTGTNGGGVYRRVRARLANSQIGNGQVLCFEGITSDGNNCGRVVRANQWLCCDATGRSFYYSCIGYASRPGDSGGPVWAPTGGNRAYAAGMVSSSVTVNGTRMTCFSTAESLEHVLRARIATG